MPKQWIINPEVGSVTTLATFGRFLENDYRMAIEHLEIPREFEEYTEKSHRKFVIIGAKSVPAATAKSVFLCLKLAGPTSIVVKAPTLDEHFLIQNVIDNYGEGVDCKIFSSNSDDLKLSHEWRKALDEATDLVVFGDENTAQTFLELENEHRTVHIHGPKFSFGIVRAEDLIPSVIQDICFDFYSFYGEGCLSPRFYVIVGDISSQQYREISAIHQTQFGPMIDEFRGKLPLTRKSELVQQFITANHMTKYVREEKLNSRELFSTLYGDTRFVLVDHVDDLEEFIDKWRSNISTVATNFSDEEVIDFLESEMITRICEFGEMQFPYFFEQFDTVDDFDIYVGDN